MYFVWFQSYIPSVIEQANQTKQGEIIKKDVLCT